MGASYRATALVSEQLQSDLGRMSRHWSCHALLLADFFSVQDWLTKQAGQTCLQ